MVGAWELEQYNVPIDINERTKKLEQYINKLNTKAAVSFIHEIEEAEKECDGWNDETKAEVMNLMAKL